MIWFKIVKHSIPKTGKYYWDWKKPLSIEGKHQCVYCAISEGAFGGIRNFHVEHYRPKSNTRFKKLEHNYKNLYFACSICNCFKGDDWPNDPNSALSVKCYPDPTEVDYSTIFSMDDDYELEGNCFAAKYMIEKLFLNRPQLKIERKAYKLMIDADIILNELRNTIELLKKRPLYKNPKLKLLIDSMAESVKFNILKNKERYLQPYKEDQISR
jgi:hypothetical protein